MHYLPNVRLHLQHPASHHFRRKIQHLFLTRERIKTQHSIHQNIQFIPHSPQLSHPAKQAFYVRSDNSSRICVTVAASCVAVYQIYVLLYKKAGVEPPTYPQFRTLMKATLMDNVMGRGQYEDF